MLPTLLPQNYPHKEKNYCKCVINFGSASATFSYGDDDPPSGEYLYIVHNQSGNIYEHMDDSLGDEAGSSITLSESGCALTSEIRHDLTTETQIFNYPDIASCEAKRKEIFSSNVHFIPSGENFIETISLEQLKKRIEGIILATDNKLSQSSIDTKLEAKAKANDKTPLSWTLKVTDLEDATNCIIKAELEYCIPEYCAAAVPGHPEVKGYFKATLQKILYAGMEDNFNFANVNSKIIMHDEL